MKFIAYETAPSDGFSLEVSSHRRDWMDATCDRSAYRCLPMLLANQAGWIILNPGTVRVKWDGGANLDAIEMQRWQPADSTDNSPDYVWPSSHFGVGIITWALPYLFRTPPGYNLLVRGPANNPKDGVAPLEGLVETDWATATFTMNWQITRPDTWITFRAGEPLCMIVPQRRGELQQFAPEILALSSNHESQSDYERWCVSRDIFNAERKQPDSDAARQGWEKNYFRGTSPGGSVTSSDHQTKLRLNPFEDNR